MSEIKFDHSKTDLFEALGLGQAEKEALCEKQAAISTKLVTGEIKKASEIAEEIQKNFSYNELVISATNNLEDKTKAALLKHPEMLLAAIFGGSKDDE